MSFELTHFLQEKKTIVERKLTEILLAEAAAPPALLEAMRYTLLAPGKRVRPALVFMANAAAGGGDDDSAWPAACAVEMIHTYSLIHDDLPAMDDDDLRRGIPTCHKKFGEAMAILAGDGLLTFAFQVLAQHGAASVAATCCLELARGAGVAGMVGGQVEDLAEEQAGQKGCTETSKSLQALERIHLHKTGALFRACLRLGVLTAQAHRSAGPDGDLLARLGRYGELFGLVFQITDDLLDVEGDAEQTGKRTQKDAARGKLTYPGLLGVSESRRLARDLVAEALGLLSPLGQVGEPLASLMQFVLARNR